MPLGSRGLGSIAALCLAGAACGSQPSSSGGPTTPTPPSAAIRALTLSATAGFRHDSIVAARQALAGAAAATGRFTVTSADDVAGVSAASLDSHDVLVFLMTSGELPFTVEQKTAILTFVSRGGGFVGVHSAADTLYGWPEYGELVGVYFREHPWTRRATVIVEDRTHPTTSALDSSFSIEEEFYTFRENPRPRVHVLLRLDAASVGGSGDYPLAWTRAYGRGRVYYNALGHFAATWNNPLFQRQIVEAIVWAGGSREDRATVPGTQEKGAGHGFERQADHTLAARNRQ
jgi:type 1 glutamine amidotransferase